MFLSTIKNNMNKEKKSPNKWLIISVITAWTILLPMLYSPSLPFIIGAYLLTILYIVFSKFGILKNLTPKNKKQIKIILSLIILTLIVWKIIIPILLYLMSLFSWNIIFIVFIVFIGAGLLIVFLNLILIILQAILGIFY